MLISVTGEVQAAAQAVHMSYYSKLQWYLALRFPTI